MNSALTSGSLPFSAATSTACAAGPIATSARRLIIISSGERYIASTRGFAALAACSSPSALMAAPVVCRYIV